MATIRVGARSSPLSRAQFFEIQQLLPRASLSPHFIETRGDCDKKTSLRTLGRCDFFTREIDELLLNRSLDAAIHSAKDLPDPLPQGLCLVALTAGVDPRDAMVLPDGVRLEDLPAGAVVATSSVRREEAARQLRPDFQFVDLRGTIEERLAQLSIGTIDGVILAEAALVRLKLTHLNRYFLPGTGVEQQGRLAVVAREGDEAIRALFSPLDARGQNRPWTILYLGLDPAACPSRGRIYHYPVIRTEPIAGAAERIAALWPQATHLIFTSKSALRHLPPSLSGEGKTLIAIGEATAALARKWGEPLIAQTETQEGVVELLEGLDLSKASLCWPRSARSRPLLETYLRRRNVVAKIVDLYDTKSHQPGFAPSLEEIDEIVFMSPSCVEGFSRIYGNDFAGKKVTVRGPVTAAAWDAQRVLVENFSAEI